METMCKQCEHHVRHMYRACAQHVNIMCEGSRARRPGARSWPRPRQCTFLTLCAYSFHIILLFLVTIFSWLMSLRFLRLRTAKSETISLKKNKSLCLAPLQRLVCTRKCQRCAVYTGKPIPRRPQRWNVIRMAEFLRSRGQCLGLKGRHGSRNLKSSFMG